MKRLMAGPELVVGPAPLVGRGKSERAEAEELVAVEVVGVTAAELAAWGPDNPGIHVGREWDKQAAPLRAPCNSRPWWI